MSPTTDAKLPAAYQFYYRAAWSGTRLDDPLWSWRANCTLTEHKYYNAAPRTVLYMWGEPAGAATTADGTKGKDMSLLLLQAMWTSRKSHVAARLVLNPTPNQGSGTDLESLPQTEPLAGISTEILMDHLPDAAQHSVRVQGGIEPRTACCDTIVNDFND